LDIFGGTAGGRGSARSTKAGALVDLRLVRLFHLAAGRGLGVRRGKVFANRMSCPTLRIFLRERFARQFLPHLRFIRWQLQLMPLQDVFQLCLIEIRLLEQVARCAPLSLARPRWRLWPQCVRLGNFRRHAFVINMLRLAHGFLGQSLGAEELDGNPRMRRCSRSTSLPSPLQGFFCGMSLFGDLKTNGEEDALRLVNAKNEAERQPGDQPADRARLFDGQRSRRGDQEDSRSRST